MPKDGQAKAPRIVKTLSCPRRENCDTYHENQSRFDADYDIYVLENGNVYCRHLGWACVDAERIADGKPPVSATAKLVRPHGGLNA